MKLKDIQVGEHYAVGSDVAPFRAEALEVGQITQRTRWRGYGWREETITGIRVRYDWGNEEVVRPQQVRRTWDEQATINQRQDEAREARSRALSATHEAGDVLRTELHRFGVTPVAAMSRRTLCYELAFSHQDIERLTEILRGVES